jgi:hypothetical protein
MEVEEVLLGEDSLFLLSRHGSMSSRGLLVISYPRLVPLFKEIRTSAVEVT